MRNLVLKLYVIYYIKKIHFLEKVKYKADKFRGGK